ncbi:Putative SOS response-associated peptidase YedK [Arenibacter nanhaiticus]|uniref:Abasic site processing protein n=1 Tax=Arenibacter nanhaiticus TaxID=558155 RepID=A0A1M6IXI9_9FLAO|nr:SOS response-associated peptidase family protein [Arenibacter nanhaiticus]SHJ39121.1 Putative SOS response-associated peptidase YedK [Arenibacter nanhaiticus]
MCYSTRVTRKAKELELFYKVSKLVGARAPEGELVYPHANGWNHPLLWIIPQEAKENLTPSMWGIMPPQQLGADYREYYKGAARFGAGLNARSEKLFDHFIYKNSVYTKRCILPVDGFFEPHTAPKKFKVPFYFERKDREILSLAGLYTVTKDGYNTFTVLTKAATPLFAKIHNEKFRRPVILNDADIAAWLDDSLGEADIKNLIATDMSDEAFRAYPVSKDLYSRKQEANRKDVIDQVDYPQIEISY